MKGDESTVKAGLSNTNPKDDGTQEDVSEDGKTKSTSGFKATGSRT